MTPENIAFLEKERDSESHQPLSYRTLTEKQLLVVQEALDILSTYLERMSYTEYTRPEVVRSYLKLKLATKQQEVFACLFLDNQNRLIEYRELFFGTINSCPVYGREIVRQSIFYNAATVVLAHNHPSGACEPSAADKKITTLLKDLLTLIDVRLIDHFVVGDNDIVSFAERGLL